VNFAAARPEVDSKYSTRDGQSGAEFGRHLALFLTLWGRGDGATRCVVLKATSIAGRMAVPILASSANSKAIYMNLRAEPYLATLLAGQNSPIDLRGHGPGRIRRLQARVGVPLAPLHADPRRTDSHELARRIVDAGRSGRTAPGEGRRGDFDRSLTTSRRA
jgi:hypothetical protein